MRSADEMTSILRMIKLPFSSRLDGPVMASAPCWSLLANTVSTATASSTSAAMAAKNRSVNTCLTQLTVPTPGRSSAAPSCDGRSNSRKSRKCQELFGFLDAVGYCAAIAAARAAAWAMRSMTSSVCARPTKIASYAPGAMATPSASIAWKNRA